MPIYYTRREAAAYLKERYKRGSYPWLTRLAGDGLGPRHHRFGRAVLYARTDLDDWAQSNIRAADIQPDLFDWADQNEKSAAHQVAVTSDEPVILAATADDAVARAFALMRAMSL